MRDRKKRYCKLSPDEDKYCSAATEKNHYGKRTYICDIYGDNRRKLKKCVLK